MRKLTANEVEARVSMVTDKGCQLLLYKTARVDRAILDEEFGALNWQTDFKVVNDNLYCGIGVYDSNKSEWVWKWDCGVESFSDKEKGEASDSFKRAGFKWGIGIELYNSPFIWLNIPTKKEKDERTGKERWVLANKFQRFGIGKIEFDDTSVVALEIIDSKTSEILYSIGKKTLPQQPQQPTPAQKAAQTRADNKAEFEVRFDKAYSYLQRPDARLELIEQSFPILMAEAEKRKHQPQKQAEMWDWFDSLSKRNADYIPTFETLNAG
jgi:hypothetical protein